MNCKNEEQFVQNGRWKGQGYVCKGVQNVKDEVDFAGKGDGEEKEEGGDDGEDELGERGGQAE